MAFLGIPDHRRISKLRGINERLGNKSTPRNHPNVPCAGKVPQQIPVPLSGVVSTTVLLGRVHRDLRDMLGKLGPCSWDTAGKQIGQGREPLQGELL